MRGTTQQTRQLLGCGYEPPIEEKLRLYVEPWDHGGRDRDKDEPLVCIGYTRTLPEVGEASWAHWYTEKGELRQFCEGQSTPELREAVQLYAVELSRMHAWAQDHPPEKK